MDRWWYSAWNIVEETGLFRLKGHVGEITALEFYSSFQATKMPRLLSMAKEDGLLKLWDLEW